VYAVWVSEEGETPLARYEREGEMKDGLKSDE
jgi:hypothetical protein